MSRIASIILGGFLATALCCSGIGIGTARAAAIPLVVPARSHVGIDRPLSCGEESGPIGFSVPPGGGNTWQQGDPTPEHEFLLSLLTVLQPRAWSQRGSSTLIAEVNGELVDSVNVISDREDGQPVWRWGTNDLVRGPRAGAVSRHGGPVTTRNYLPFNSIHAGRNVLRFRVECPGSVPLARFTVLGGTRLRETGTQPAHLRLTATSTSEPEVGKATRVDFRLDNVGDLPAVGVNIRVRSIDGKEIIVGRKELRYDELQGGEQGSFFVIPRHAGPVRVEVGVESGNSNQPAVRLRGVSARAGAAEGGENFPWASVVFGAIAIGGLLAFVWLRLRVRREARTSRASEQPS